MAETSVVTTPKAAMKAEPADIFLPSGSRRGGKDRGGEG